MKFCIKCLSIDIGQKCCSCKKIIEGNVGDKFIRRDKELGMEVELVIKKCLSCGRPFVGPKYNRICKRCKKTDSFAFYEG
jgi:hypothetical protein